jgi:hypothetical protein
MELVRILLIVGVFFLPIVMIILIVWFKSAEKRNRQRLQAELYAKALEKGQPIPSDLFAEPFSARKKRNPLNTGIICIAIGIGISLFIWLGATSAARLDANAGAFFVSWASLGIIPFLIGIAYVIIHFLEKGKTADEDAK